MMKYYPIASSQNELFQEGNGFGQRILAHQVSEVQTKSSNFF